MDWAIDLIIYSISPSISAFILYASLVLASLPLQGPSSQGLVHPWMQQEPPLRCPYADSFPGHQKASTMLHSLGNPRLVRSLGMLPMLPSAILIPATALDHESDGELLQQRAGVV